jgi:hypothetical protein
MVWDKAVGHDFAYKPNLFLELLKEIAVVVLVHIRQHIILALFAASSWCSFIVALLKNKIDRFAVKESKSQID